MGDRISRREFARGVAGAGAAILAAVPLPALAADPTVCSSAVAFASRNEPRKTLIRPNAGDVDVEKLRRAYARMIEWSKSNPDDGRSWQQQSLIHYAAQVRMRKGDPVYAIHQSYYFYPWHRAYLYFHERVLAWHLTGQKSLDPTFRLPVWNWEASFNSLTVPNAYLPARDDFGKSNPLYRDRAEAGNASKSFPSGDSDPRLRFNVDRVTDFYGDAPGGKGGGSIEDSVHANVHVYTGGNMLDIARSSNDPLFFAHHANVDKMWAWYRTMQNAFQPDFADWTRVAWTFTDYDGRCISVQPANLIDEGELRYQYAVPTIKLVEQQPHGTQAHATLSNSQIAFKPADRQRALGSRSVQLTLRNVAIAGPGTFDVAVASKSQSGPRVIGRFSVFAMDDVRHWNAFLDVSASKAALLGAPSARLLVAKRGQVTAAGLVESVGSGEGFQELKARDASLNLH